MTDQNHSHSIVKLEWNSLIYNNILLAQPLNTDPRHVKNLCF